jgi:hypothetical protein
MRSALLPSAQYQQNIFITTPCPSHVPISHPPGWAQSLPMVTHPPPQVPHMIHDQPPVQPAPSITIPPVKTLRDAIDQWLYGDAQQGLSIPLKDWKKRMYTGSHNASIGAIYGKRRRLGEKFREWVFLGSSKDVSVINLLPLKIRRGCISNSVQPHNGFKIWRCCQGS